jgi:hypothetical protein
LKQLDSSKFKKIENNTPKNKKSKRKNNHKKTLNKNNEYIKRKEHKKSNNKKIISIIGLLLLLVIAGLFVGNAIFNSYVMGDAVLIKPTGFNLTPYGYSWDNEIYGYAIATDENGTQSTYYFTLDQMAALASESSNTYDFSDGIYVSYNNNNSKNYNLVSNIYKKNGDEIVKPAGFDTYNFVSNARFIGKESDYCMEGFGFTEKEYKDSVL